MMDAQYDGMMGLLGDIRDRLPAPAAPVLDRRALVDTAAQHDDVIELATALGTDPILVAGMVLDATGLFNR